MTERVVIVGAGPAGLFAAREVARRAEGDVEVIVYEQGPDVDERLERGEVMRGVGGAGGLSDGVLNLRPDVGGDLTEIVGNRREAERLVEYVDEVFLRHGAPKELREPSGPKAEEIARRAAAADVEFVRIPQRHIGSDHLPKVIKSFVRELEELGVRIVTKTRVERILASGEEVRGVRLEDGREVEADYVIVAPGRVGADWMIREAKRLGLGIRYNPIDVGVRVEVPKVVMDPIVEVSLDPKFRLRTPTYDDQVRTFCVCHGGYVVKETYEGFVGVNGHSYRDRKSENTNFAFLVSVDLTEPVENTIKYGRSIGELATTIGGNRPILQRLGDLRRGRRSTWDRINRSQVTPTLTDVTPGDVSMALPHRVTLDIIEGLEILDEVIPGVASDSTLLYAPEIKFYSARVRTNEELETAVEGLFVAGDGAGLSRDIVNAAATGVIAGRAVAERVGG
ncbi:MAG: NAD(P)/FAD-dependent oxidoreductase [Euryarchaeota archaeon]